MTLEKGHAIACATDTTNTRFVHESCALPIRKEKSVLCLAFDLKRRNIRKKIADAQTRTARH